MFISMMIKWKSRTPRICGVCPPSTRLTNLKAELGKGVSVLTIGPAGENQVPYSIVLAEGGASGSGGIGALMGSKNLKAIVVAGDKKPQAAHPDKVRQLVKLIRDNREKSPMLPVSHPWPDTPAQLLRLRHRLLPGDLPRGKRQGL